MQPGIKSMLNVGLILAPLTNTGAMQMWTDGKQEMKPEAIIHYSFSAIPNGSHLARYLTRRGPFSLQWRHDERDGFPNHQPYDCLLNRLFMSRSKKTSKLRVTGRSAGNSRQVNSLHKGPATRRMFPFDDVIMLKSVKWIVNIYW